MSKFQGKKHFPRCIFLDERCGFPFKPQMFTRGWSFCNFDVLFFCTSQLVSSPIPLGRYLMAPTYCTCHNACPPCAPALSTLLSMLQIIHASFNHPKFLRKICLRDSNHPKESRIRWTTDTYHNIRSVRSLRDPQNDSFSETSTTSARAMFGGKNITEETMVLKWLCLEFDGNCSCFHCDFTSDFRPKCFLGIARQGLWYLHVRKSTGAFMRLYPPWKFS